MKALIFDSGPLINLSMNGLLQVLEKLKSSFQGKFLITSYVNQEVYEYPVQVQQFELGALRIKQLIKRGVIEYPDSLNIAAKELEHETRKLTNLANTSLRANEKSINIVSEAEMSCIALSKILERKDIKSIIVIDERTARILSEKPENLQRLMSARLHQKIIMITNNLKEFQGLSFIRSPELVYVAYKKGLIELDDSRALEALLYATKFKGAAISWEEINVLKKL